MKEKRKKGKALVNMNQNPHHLGSGGYITAKPKWAKALADGKLPEVQGIESDRAQDWVMARMPKAGPNNYVIPENIKEITNQIVSFIYIFVCVCVSILYFSGDSEKTKNHSIIIVNL